MYHILKGKYFIGLSTCTLLLLRKHLQVMLRSTHMMYCRAGYQESSKSN